MKKDLLETLLVLFLTILLCGGGLWLILFHLLRGLKW